MDLLKFVYKKFFRVYYCNFKEYLRGMCEADVSFRGNSLIVESSDFTFYNSRIFDRLKSFGQIKNIAIYLIYQEL